jgi:hypothetical protein
MFKGSNLGLIAASTAKAPAKPLADAATYSLSIGKNGLTVKPVSEAAVAAVNQWQ